jgi:D-sedoheptulose 7-phosphate isomerase
MIREYAKKYLQSLKVTIDEISLNDLQDVADAIEAAYRRGKQIFIFGNGGSASTASHFACDLGKGIAIKGKPRFKVMSLNENVALMTAIGNDLGFEALFVEQLENMLEEGDVVILISGSGNSENLLRAARFANSKGAITIGFLGFGGGDLRNLVKKHITLSSDQYELVEPVHIVLEHLISFYFKEKIAREN